MLLAVLRPVDRLSTLLDVVLTVVEIEFTDAVSVDDEPAVLQQTIALLGLENAARVQASYARLQQEWDSRKKRR